MNEVLIRTLLPRLLAEPTQPIAKQPVEPFAGLRWRIPPDVYITCPDEWGVMNSKLLQQEDPD